MKKREDIIEQIYESATNPDLWSDTMHDIGQIVDADAGAIFTRRNDAWLGWRCSPVLEKGADVFLSAPWRSQSTTKLLGMSRAGFVAEQEAFIEEEYLADPLMSDWCSALGLHHCAATAIPMPTGDLVVVQVNRRIGKAAFAQKELSLLDSLRPHLARAGVLSTQWRLAKLRAATEAMAIIGLPAAILDASQRVLAANELIQNQQSHICWGINDRISFNDQRANRLFIQSLTTVCDHLIDSSCSFPSKGVFDDLAVAHLIPIAGEGRDLFDGGVVILVIMPLGQVPTTETSVIQGLFDLTSAEAKVAAAIAQGLAVDDMAQVLGKSRETIRSQVKSVLAKTGYARQHDLALMLSAASLPANKVSSDI